MKEKKLKNIRLIVLLIISIICLTTNVYATDLIDISSNSTVKPSTGTSSGVDEITQIDKTTFTTVSETVYAKSNVNIKKDYKTTSDTIATLTKDQSIKRIGISNDGWSKVQTSSGAIGYVQTTNLTTEAPKVSTIENTNSSIYNGTKNNTNNTLPQAGIGDHTGMFIIMGICVISAIYAYKKIRDYNI